MGRKVQGESPSPLTTDDNTFMPMPDSMKEIFPAQIDSAPLQPILGTPLLIMSQKLGGCCSQFSLNLFNYLACF